MPDSDPDDEPTDWSQMRDWRKPVEPVTWGRVLWFAVPMGVGLVLMRDTPLVMGAWSQILSAFGAR